MAKHTGKIDLNPGNYIKQEFIDCLATVRFTNSDFDRYYIADCKINKLALTFGSSHLTLSTDGKGILTIEKRIIPNKGIYLFIKVENLELNYYNITDFRDTYNWFVEFHNVKSVSDISILVKRVSMHFINSRFKHIKSYNNNVEELNVEKSRFDFLYLTRLSEDEKNEIKKFKFENSVSREIGFEQVSFPNSFQFIKSYAYQLSYTNCIVTKNNFFLNRKNPNDLRLKNLFLHNNTYPNGIKIEFTKRKIGLINIFVGENNTGNIYLEDIEVDTILICGQRNKHNIILRNLKLSSLAFVNFSSDARVIINFIRALKNGFDFSLSHSELNNFDFFNIDFETEKASFTVQDSVLRNFNSVNVVWPKNINLIQVRSKAALRNAYLQLKSAMLAQNNKIQALRFEALEMDAYRKELIEAKGRRSEKLILFLSRSNSFGQDWGKALGIYILFALGLAVVFSFSATGIGLWSDNFTAGSNDYWAAFGAAINPTHSFKELCDNLDVANPSGWLIILDVLIRIIAAFFYFQIISAFRKYAKG